MSPTQTVDITISNRCKELVNYIVLDSTTAIVNIHVNTDYLPEEI